MIAANRFAAVKIIYGDDEVIMCRTNKQEVTGYNVHIWLANTDEIHIGNWFLKILHTPGHTSGCLSIYDRLRGFFLLGARCSRMGHSPVTTKKYTTNIFFLRLKTFFILFRRYLVLFHVGSPLTIILLTSSQRRNNLSYHPKNRLLPSS
ncbi:MAG: hypothetical protein SVJ22_09555 [Halobacteriota archaeon]|nr:hypothetical protein [Halobacteriota archaeon]